jgi:uncharacterized membrane protein
VADPVFWAFATLFVAALVIVGLLSWYGRNR